MIATNPTEQIPSLITFSRNAIRIGEIYFQQYFPVKPHHADLIHFVGVLHPDVGNEWQKSTTLIIELIKSEETLLKEMDSGTRYEIRRAQNKDTLTHSVNFTSEKTNIDSFCDYYDVFAKSKLLRPIFRPRLYALADNGNLLLSSMSTDAGHVLVQHAHLVTTERAMLLYSASFFRETDDSATRSLVGRANRLLHWEDMRTARKHNIPQYDMCGVDITSKSAETTRIAQFKMGFGGTTMPCYSRTIPASVKGRLAQVFLRCWGKSF